jgi:hypothetical protein
VAEAYEGGGGGWREWWRWLGARAVVVVHPSGEEGERGFFANKIHITRRAAGVKMLKWRQPLDRWCRDTITHVHMCTTLPMCV